MIGYTVLTDLYSRILLELRGLSKPLAMQHIIDTARDFFHVTQAWQFDLPAISVVADQTDYDISPPLEGVEIDAVLKVEWAGSTMAAGSDYSLDHQMDRIILKSEPDAAEADALVVTVALKPSLTCTEIPTRLFNDWCECLAAGAKARLCAIPDKLWSNPKQAAYYDGEYRKHLQRAAWDVKRQRTMRVVSIKPPFFA